ncbi:MAG TPA: hypothetical protein VE028_00245 [Nitratidesulfovibrio sp.]|nr:hypothetical protein [Nitratidesulfovibrio sp.]
MTGYAIRLDGTGWRAVDGPDDVAAWESYGTDHPPVDDSGVDCGPPDIPIGVAEQLYAKAQAPETNPEAVALMALLDL